MPIRLRARPQPERDMSPVSSRTDFTLPEIDDNDSFRHVATKLSLYSVDAIDLPTTFEQMRTTAAGNFIGALVNQLKDSCSNPAVVHALLALKWHYASTHERMGLTETRSNACEILAWRYLARLSEREAMDCCLYDIPDFDDTAKHRARRPQRYDQEAAETSPLIPPSLLASREVSPALVVGSSAKRTKLENSLPRLTNAGDDLADEQDPTSAFKGLNALEIATIADAKHFLSQHAVQRIISGIWNGDIVFWDSLSVHATNQPRYYNPETSDAFSRLRVPKYLKSWEVLFFAVFLCIYYSVLVARVESRITANEVMLFIWMAAFAYDELSELMDAGSVFYATDIWNLFDMVMIIIALVFAVLSAVYDAAYLLDLEFESVLGNTDTVLERMGKDFIKFMVLVVIIYLGFLTTFSLIGRDSFSLANMTGILTRIFFGSSYVGLDIMSQIDSVFGPPLMLIFITLTSILLTGSLTGMLSNSFYRVITHAKEEYLYVYSVYVLEASTSNRLTHFYPPFNLFALIIFRPLRLVFGRDERFRAGRIVLLKATHLPVVAAIKAYELIQRKLKRTHHVRFDERTRAKRAAERTPVPRGRPVSGHLRQPRQPFRDLYLGRGGEFGDNYADSSGLVDVQIAELNQKLDKLTDLIMALQAGQTSIGKAAESQSQRQ